MQFLCVDFSLVYCVGTVVEGRLESFSKNGMGITSAESNMHIAYVSSLAATIQSNQSLAAFTHYNTTTHPLPANTPLHDQLTVSLNIVH